MAFNVVFIVAFVTSRPGTCLLVSLSCAWLAGSSSRHNSSAPAAAVRSRMLSWLLAADGLSVQMIKLLTIARRSLSGCWLKWLLGARQRIWFYLGSDLV
jgi:hypothetical protein